MKFDHLKRQFPDYDVSTLPEIPVGFGDTSWRNDTCPSFTDEARGLQLFIDYAEPTDREPNTVRYGLRELDGQLENIADTNGWDEVLYCIREYDKRKAFDRPRSAKAGDVGVADLLSRDAARSSPRDDAETLEVLLADVRPLSEDAALEKWDGFKDTAIQNGFGSQQERIAGLAKTGATKAQLIRFWRETKHLSWPASYGQSPWETASSVGASLDAAIKGGTLSAYNRGIIYVFERTMSGLAAPSDEEKLKSPPQAQQPRLRM